MTVKLLLNEGVEKKRQGDYAGAKQAYYKAIQIDPTQAMIFYSLAKVCYLTGERDEAVTNYLRAAHLSLAAVAEAVSDDPAAKRAVEQRLRQIPPGVIADLRRAVHKDAPLAFMLDNNTTCHLAHAAFDFYNISAKPSEIVAYIETYRMALAGYGGNLDDTIENEIYLSNGRGFLWANLRWDRITELNVVDLYPFTSSSSSSTEKTTSGTRVVKGYEIKPGANLADADLSGADLEKVDLSRANLGKANLSQADLAGANLSGTDLSNANLREANLEGANLYRANIMMTDFSGANLFRANMTNTQAMLPNFTGTIMPDGRKSISPFGDVFEEEGAPQSVNDANMAPHNVDKAETHCELGDQYMLEGEFSDAIHEYKAALSLNPNHVRAHFYLSLAYGRKGLKGDEIRELQEVLRIDPRHAGAHTILGAYFLEQKQYDKAMYEFEIAKGLGDMLARGQMGHIRKLAEIGWIQIGQPTPTHSTTSSTHHIRGSAHLEARRHIEAIHEYQTAIRVEGDYAEAHLSMALAYTWLKQNSNAKREFEVALRLNPNLAEAHRGLGIFYMAEGHFDKATSEFLESARLNPDLAATHYNLAIAFGKQERLNETRAELELAAALGDEDAKKVLADYGIG